MFVEIKERNVKMAIKIFIDQGHNPTGYHNSGAAANGLYEQDITYNVGKYLYDLLENDIRFEAKLSRPDADTVLGYNNSSSLRERVDMANAWGADYFLSIHVNASENEEANGTEVYVYNNPSEAYNLAEQILMSIVSNVGTKNNGVFVNKTFYVLRKTTMPSALIELAYITNYNDSLKLANDQFGFANAIYTGLKNYFGFN